MPAPSRSGALTKKSGASRTAASVASQSPTTSTELDWVERAGGSLSKIFTKSACRLCSVYAEEQVEYEKRQEDYYSTSMLVADQMMNVAAAAASGNAEVELYRQFLFDEESVLASASGRDDESVDDGIVDTATLNTRNSHRYPNTLRQPASPTRSYASEAGSEEDFRTLLTQRSN